MAGATRTVRHLRLRGPSEAAVARTVTALEDALRTASLPDPERRVVLVRCLDLGRIDPGAPPATLALKAEREMARARGEGRHGSEPDAEAADVVWFGDALDAHLDLARRVARGLPAGAWYWPLAVPDWSPRMDRSEALRAIARSVAALPEAPSALPAWVRTLAAEGHLDALSHAVRDVDLPGLMGCVGRSVDPTEEASTGRAVDSSDGGRPASGPGGRPGVSGPTATGARAAPHGTGDGEGLPPASPPVVAFLARLAGDPDTGVARPVTPARPPDGTGREPDPDRSATVTAGPVPFAGPSSPPPPAPPTGVGPGGAGKAVRDGPHAVRSGPGRRHDRTDAGRDRPVRDESVPARSPLVSTKAGVPTEAGGLLFLVPVLVRLAYPDWVVRHPEWAAESVARRVLGAILVRLDPGPGDPMWAAIAPEARGRPTSPDRFVCPDRWRTGLLSGRGPLRHGGGPGGQDVRDASGRLLLEARRGPAGPDTLTDRIVEAWIIAARRWTRRYARLGLADLVCRPATLLASRTHLDVRFHPDSVDLRVRRAGLDLDPGWVPWLGRVVSFHYRASPWP